MKIKISTENTLRIVYILSWIIFIGLCIEAGGFVANAIFAMINSSIVKNLWHQVNLSELYKFDQGYFVVIISIMSIVAVMKAMLFYLIVKILHDKKVNVNKPFSKEMGSFVFNISYLTFGIGIFSFWGFKYVEWFLIQGIEMPTLKSLRIDGADVWLFMAITLFVIAQLFKRGIELQEENELTI